MPGSAQEIHCLMLRAYSKYDLGAMYVRKIELWVPEFKAHTLALRYISLTENISL